MWPLASLSLQAVHATLPHFLLAFARHKSVCNTPLWTNSQEIGGAVLLGAPVAPSTAARLTSAGRPRREADLRRSQSQAASPDLHDSRRQLGPTWGMRISAVEVLVTDRDGVRAVLGLDGKPTFGV